MPQEVIVARKDPGYLSWDHWWGPVGLMEKKGSEAFRHASRVNHGKFPSPWNKKNGNKKKVGHLQTFIL